MSGCLNDLNATSLISGSMIGTVACIIYDLYIITSWTLKRFCWLLSICLLCYYNFIGATCLTFYYRNVFSNFAIGVIFAGFILSSHLNMQQVGLLVQSIAILNSDSYC